MGQIRTSLPERRAAQLSREHLRILDEQVNKSLDAAIIYLTKQEAAELKDSLEQLLADHLGRHEHISSDDYRKELTVCILRP